MTDPAYAPILNLQGFVIIEGTLYQYKDNVLKMMLDGDANDSELLALADKSVADQSIFVISRESGVQEKSIVEIWTKFRNNSSYDWQTFKDYRWRVWIDGHSEPVTLVDEECARQLSCTFVVRTEAQKKNFWGNYRYTSNFSPTLDYDNRWSYRYSRYNDNLCGLNTTRFTSVPTYSCNNSNFNCPTSPSSGFYPTTNNGFFLQTPHGEWTLSGPFYPNGLGFYADAFNVDNGRLTATYNNSSWDIVY